MEFTFPLGKLLPSRSFVSRKVFGAWFCNWSTTHGKLLLAQAKKRHLNPESCNVLVYLFLVFNSLCIQGAEHTPEIQMSSNARTGLREMPWQDRLELIKVFSGHGNPKPSTVFSRETLDPPVEKAELLKFTTTCPSFVSHTISWEFLGYFSQFTALWCDTA